MNGVLRGLLCLAMLSGCAPNIYDVDVKYISATEAMPVRGADSVNIKVSVSDGRTILKDRIGDYRIGYYGSENRQMVVTLVSHQDITHLIKGSLEQELLSSGFHISDSPVFILIDITGFYSALNFRPNLLPVVVGDVNFNVQVMDADARLYYAKRYVGGGNPIDISSWTGEALREFVLDGLQLAFSDAIKKVMTDEFFLQSLIDAQRGINDPKHNHKS